MSKQRLTRAVGDYVRRFATEDGTHYRTETQELGPAMRRSQLIRQAQEANGTGKYDRRYVGSIPMTVLHDWLKKHGYRMDQFARNEGGDPYKTDRVRGGGVKDKFLRHFFSRDYAKLHTQHTTTRAEAGRIIVPNYIGSKKHEDVRRTEGGDS